MKRILPLILALCTFAASAQMTVTVPQPTGGGIKNANAPLASLNMGGERDFGNQQNLKDLFMTDGGTLPQIINRTSVTCSVGGTGGTPTSATWPSGNTGGNGAVTAWSVTGNVVTLTGIFTGINAGSEVQFDNMTGATFLQGNSALMSSASGTTLTFNWKHANGSGSETGSVTIGYIANYYAGATFYAYNTAAPGLYGTGTISGNTQTTSTHGPVYGLTWTGGTPVGFTGCANQDVLVVVLDHPNFPMTPQQLFDRTGANIPSDAVFNFTDTSPASTNTTQSLQLNPNTTWELFADQQLRNATNPNATLAGQQTVFRNINGTYNQSFNVKCNAATGTVPLSYSLVRAGTGASYGSGSLTLTCNPSAHLGWQHVTNTVTGTETGAQTGNLNYTFTVGSASGGAGTVLLQDAKFEEQTAISNNTIFTDLFVQTVLVAKLDVQRFMDTSMWGQSFASMTATAGNRRWASTNNFIPFNIDAPIGYDDMLALGDYLHNSVYISGGQFNNATETGQTATWFSTNAHYINLVAAGKKVYYAQGNEAFNTGASGALFQGNGALYGFITAPKFAAFCHASGYSSTNMKRVSNGWSAPNQMYGAFGWTPNSLKQENMISCGLADLIEYAPYNFPYLNNCSAANTSCQSSGITNSGEPWTSMNAEIQNFDNLAIPPSGSISMIAAQAELNTLNASAGWQYPVQAMVYEMQNAISAEGGLAATIPQVDSVSAGVGEAVNLAHHWYSMQFFAGITGPLINFSISEPYNGYNGGGGSGVATVAPLWGFNATLACGSGQLGSCSNQPRPQMIALNMFNAARGTNNILLNVTETGQEVVNYAGGQPLSGTNTIKANPTVNLQDCGGYAGSSNTYTIMCWNFDPVNAWTVTLNGAGAPTGTVMRTVLGGAANGFTDHNEASYIATLSTPGVVVQPVAVPTSGTTYVLATNSFSTFTYSTSGGTPTAGQPVFSPATGLYNNTQTVSLTNPSSAPLVCYGTGSIVISGAGSCPVGSTLYTVPFTVSAPTTLHAVAGGSGFLDSPTATVTYTFTVATPTFSPAAGTYSSAQTVTISDATTSAVIHYTLDGTTPTTGSAGYTTPLSISVTTTVKALAAFGSFTNSAVATALYTITPTVAAPVFSPVAGTYTSAQLITITDATAGATICVGVNTTPTAPTPGTCGSGGSAYTGPFTISSTQTLNALATKASAVNSTVTVAAYTINISSPTGLTASPGVALSAGTKIQ